MFLGERIWLSRIKFGVFEKIKRKKGGEEGKFLKGIRSFKENNK